MGRSLFRRTVTVVVAAGLWMASVVVPAGAVTYRALSTDTLEDEVGDSWGLSALPVNEPRADLTGARAIVHNDGRLELTATVAQSSDPATDPNWADDGSFLMWNIDTNANGLPNYIVGLGMWPQLSGLVAALEEGSTAPAAGCQPVADYSPTRYSVTLAPTCLALPASFAWGATIIYGASPSDEGETDSAPDDQAMVAGPGPANDPTGDVTTPGSGYEPRGDLTAATIAYEPGRIDLTATLASPTDPRVDPNWADGSSRVAWYFDTDGNGEPDSVAALGATPDLTVTVFSINGNDLVVACTALATFSPSGYSVSLDPACIGSPARLWWGVETNYDGSAADIAPLLHLRGPVNATSDPQAGTAGGGQSGYWMMTNRGDVFAFGNARPLGGDPVATGSRVDIEPTRTGNGFWILSATGSLFTKGDARHLGDAAGRLQPGEQAAALSATPSGDGYWIFTDRGRVLSFGSAGHFGDMAGTRLNGQVLDSVATPTGRGYWMVASDGGIFSFGDATFSGSTGDLRLNKPVMSMAADPDGKGYWLVASDGGIFAFDAPFQGSMGGTPLNKPISGIVPGNAGYLMVAEDGGIFAFGDVAFHGSLGGKPPANPVIAVALAPN